MRLMRLNQVGPCMGRSSYPALGIDVIVAPPPQFAAHGAVLYSLIRSKS